MHSFLTRHLSLASVRALTLAVCASFMVVACGGGSDNTTVSSSSSSSSGSSSSSSSSSSGSSGGTLTYTISAQVVGLAGTVVLQDNGADNLTISTAGTSTTPFATKIAAGGAYAVTVLTQPTSPAQFCTVAARAGTAQ